MNTKTLFLQFCVVGYAATFTSFSIRKSTAVGNLPPASKTYVLTVTLPNTCNPRNWSVSYQCGSPGGGTNNTARFSSQPLVGGGGSGNPRGQEILAYLFYQGLTEQEKTSFKQSAFAPPSLKDATKLRALELEVEKETTMVETKQSISPEAQKGLKDLEIEINKISNDEIKKILSNKFKETKQKLQITQ